MGMLAGPLAAICSLLLPTSTTTEGQTLGSIVRSLRPRTPSHGVKVELVAPSPRPAPGPLTFPETG